MLLVMLCCWYCYVVVDVMLLLMLCCWCCFVAGDVMLLVMLCCWCCYVVGDVMLLVMLCCWCCYVVGVFIPLEFDLYSLHHVNRNSIKLNHTRCFKPFRKQLLNLISFE